MNKKEVEKIFELGADAQFKCWDSNGEENNIGEFEKLKQKAVELFSIDCVTNSSVIWERLENFDQTRTLAQHAFVEKERGKFWEDPYPGNISLCGKIAASDGDKYCSIDELEGEELIEEKACKSCLKIYKKSIVSNTKISITQNLAHVPPLESIRP